MGDIEDSETAPIFENDLSTKVPLTICSLHCRLKRPQLTLSELIFFAAILSTCQCVCAIGIIFMPSISIEKLDYAAFFALLPIGFMYILIYANLFAGGWGDPNGRFWCDVKIMYVRGFNTLRTIVTYMTTPIYMIYLAHLVGIHQFITLFFIGLLAMISEWQYGISENQNQYDVKAFDKFINPDDNTICLETLHNHQLNRTSGNIFWSGMMMGSIIKILVISATLIGGQSPTITFGIPIVTLIIIYACIIEIVLSILYLKKTITFCQIELYRLVADLTMPFLIFIFTLV